MNEPASLQPYVYLIGLGAMILSALMILVWLLRVKTAGLTAYLMASAFAVFGLLTYLFINQRLVWVQVTLAALLVLLLAGDFAVRSGREYRKRHGKER